MSKSRLKTCSRLHRESKWQSKDLAQVCQVAETFLPNATLFSSVDAQYSTWEPHVILVKIEYHL